MGLVWLASYPKSGSTWMRALLVAAFGDGTVDLGALGGAPRLARPAELAAWLGAEVGEVTPGEALALWPAVARRMAKEAETQVAPTLVKLHAANRTTESGERVVPAGAGGALLVVRNPLDVAVSLAPFMGASTAEAVAALADARFTLNPLRPGFAARLPERLLSWSGHAASWLDAPTVPMHVVRYEDLHADPAGTLADALRFLRVTPDADRLAAAVEAARFERLRAAEVAGDFHQRPGATAPFFRRGRVGAWRDELAPALARRVVADHALMMRRLGYGDLIAEVGDGA